jgi:hypothetical protein
MPRDRLNPQLGHLIDYQRDNGAHHVVRNGHGDFTH